MIILRSILQSMIFKIISGKKNGSVLSTLIKYWYALLNLLKYVTCTSFAIYSFQHRLFKRLLQPQCQFNPVRYFIKGLRKVCRIYILFCEPIWFHGAKISRFSFFRTFHISFKFLVWSHFFYDFLQENQVLQNCNYYFTVFE